RYDVTSSKTFSRLSDATIADQDDEELTSRAGIVYLFDNGVAPYAGYAESFLPSAGTDAEGNAFEPETARQYEVGVKYEPPGFDGIFTLALFDIQRDNFVGRDPDFVDFQTGRALSRGVEVEAFATLDNGLSVIANYNYLETDIEDHPNPDLVGKSAPQIPEHKASVWLDYDVQRGTLAGLGLGVGVRYQSSTYSDDLNTIKNPGVTLFDAAVYYQWDAYKLSVNVQNLEDDEHTAACFQRSSLLCSFGEGRSIRGTLKVRW
ncbi:MAG TPA: TonB-dependent siderophore receptor, partial [Gammaproteobacteria bacterium]|nr:TonB-dependent siderophore receptor [Gammaproteobacteria bacterium]